MSIKKDGSISISFSEISQFLQCPFAHNLKYLQNIKQPTNEFFEYGHSMHIGLQFLYKSNNNLKESIEIFKKELKNRFNNLQEGQKSNYKKYLKNGEALIKYFFKSKWINYECIGIEYKIEKEIFKNVFFKGFIDLILYDKESDIYWIVDFKTSSNGWDTKAKKNKIKQLQLKLYKYFVIKDLKINENKIRCVFILLKGSNRKTEEIEIVASENVCIRAFKFLGVIIKNIYILKNNNYKNINDCYYCYFNSNPSLCDKISIQKDYVDLNKLVQIIL